MDLQIAFTSFVYPSLILAYMGQAAYLSQHHGMENQVGFYVSVPGKNPRLNHNYTQKIIHDDCFHSRYVLVLKSC